MNRAIDMSSAAVEDRLRVLSERSPLSLRPLARVSMSPRDIEARLLECSELSAACAELTADTG